MKRVRTAVIGCGHIGRRHIETLLKIPGAELLAAADLNLQAVSSAVEKFDIPLWTQDPAELAANPDVDAVILALPTGVRAAAARDFLRAGKHVLLEKPAAMNSAELRELKGLMQDQIVACASSRFRATPLATEAARFLRSGRLGKIRTVQVRAIVPAGTPPEKTPPAWRLRRELNGGGILVNWGVYDLDFLLGILDWKLQPVEVSAHCWSISGRISNWIAENSDAETHVKALVQCQDNIILDYERAEYFGGPDESSWRIVGENGTLELPMLSRKESRLVFHELTPSGRTEHTLWTVEEQPDVHAGTVRDFIEAILEHRPPLTGIDESITICSLVDHIYQSAALNRPVPFHS